VAVALTATLPVLIAHGALATTDVAFAGMFLLAILMLVRWFESPTLSRSSLLGAAVGLAVLTKFSTLLFFPVAIMACAGARRIVGLSVRPIRGDMPIRWSALAGQVGMALMASLLMTWSGYRFSVGPIGALPFEVKDWLHILPPVGARVGLTGLLLRLFVPMPELFHGLRFLVAHDRVGHEAYLLGKTAQHGFLAFYPVALLVKTPLPLLALLLASVPILARRRSALWPAQAVALAALGILLVSLRSHVNLGIRHVFVLLPLLSVAIARAIDEKLEAWRGQGSRRALAAIVVGALVLSQAGIAVATRKQQLGYFNALAGPDPATILLDSDLDWGQDLFALRDEARRLGIDTLKIAYFGTLRQCQHGLPTLQALVPGKETTGWIAISENFYRHRGAFPLLKDPCDFKSMYGDNEVAPLPFAWLHSHTPVAIAGSSIRIYHIDP
jgi:4-amino-4-deoxy-L-arabinose transferase-like glycosyltransferase